MRRGTLSQFLSICVAHWLSHVYLLILPLLFPFLRDMLSASYLELALAVTVFSCVSSVTQTPIGFAVDRIGPRRVLVAGVALGGLTLILLSQALTYSSLLVVAALLGLANSAYHPANYAILSTTVQDHWMGRAFSIHTFAGQLGTATAPALTAFLISLFGGRGAIFAAGLLGLILALVLALVPAATGRGHTDHAKSRQESTIAMLLMPRLMMLTGFFLLLSLSLVGISNFGIVAFESGYGMSVSTGTLLLSIYLGLSAVGVLAGGLLADRMRRHGLVLAACFGANAALVGIVAIVSGSVETIAILMGIAGLFGGLIAPSRDMLVRKLAPPGAIGRVFALVTTGFTLGGMVGPLIFGTVMDLGLPRLVFALTALAMLLALAFSLAADRSAERVDHGAPPA